MLQLCISLSSTHLVEEKEGYEHTSPTSPLPPLLLILLSFTIPLSQVTPKPFSPPPSPTLFVFTHIRLTLNFRTNCKRSWTCPHHQYCLAHHSPPQPSSTSSAQIIIDFSLSRHPSSSSDIAQHPPRRSIAGANRPPINQHLQSSYPKISSSS